MVIAIIGILASLLLPALSRAQENARRAVCRSNHRQLYVALATYADDHGGYLPRQNHLAIQSGEVKVYPPVGHFNAGPLFVNDYLPDKSIQLQSCPSFEPDLAAAANATAMGHAFKLGQEQVRAGVGYKGLSEWRFLSVAVRTAQAWVTGAGLQLPEHERLGGDYLTGNRLLLWDVFSTNSAGGYVYGPYACGWVHKREGTVCTLEDGSSRWLELSRIAAVGQAKGWWVFSNHYTSYPPWRADLGNAALFD